VRHGAEKAEISLEVDIHELPQAYAWLQAQDLADSREMCLLRRTVNIQGKSRAWINGSTVTLSQLRELGEQLVDIHGQHEHQSLMKKEAQRHLLDAFAQNDTVLQATKQAWQHWKKLHERIQYLSTQSQQYHERLDLLKFQAQELASLELQADEIAQLDEELSRLANAEQLRSTAANSYQQLYEAEPSLYSVLSRTLSELEQQLKLDTKLEPAVELLTSTQIQLHEAASQLRDYAEHLELDPQRLHWVENRIADIRSMARKYRIEPELLLAKLHSVQTELEHLDNGEFDLAALQSQLSEASQQYQMWAAQLSQIRQQAAAQLSVGVSQAMQQLGMQGGRFVIQVQANATANYQALGTDQIEFLVSANPGQPLKPLIKVASGGELSRISLAIQMIAAQRVTLPALIFDEVDTGIGGGIAEVVGKQLRQLGHNRQVLCVTHLPQVASQAHQHYRVTKVKSFNATRTGIEVLDAAQRIDEIARMIGGLEMTPATLALASEMLATAQ
jgi:DNA repair protein RecN (Recombination protein N)